MVVQTRRIRNQPAGEVILDPPTCPTSHHIDCQLGETALMGPVLGEQTKGDQLATQHSKALVMESVKEWDVGAQLGTSLHRRPWKVMTPMGR